MPHARLIWAVTHWPINETPGYHSAWHRSPAGKVRELQSVGSDPAEVKDFLQLDQFYICMDLPIKLSKVKNRLHIISIHVRANEWNLTLTKCLGNLILCGDSTSMVTTIPFEPFQLSVSVLNMEYSVSVHIFCTNLFIDRVPPETWRAMKAISSQQVAFLTFPDSTSVTICRNP